MSPLAVVSGGTRGIGLHLQPPAGEAGAPGGSRRTGVTPSRRRRRRPSSAPRSTRSGSTSATPTRSAPPCETVLAEHGPPTVLVNNAGINIDRPFLEMSTEDWRAVLDTNLSGVFHLTRAFAPAMLAAGRDGVIVNVGATTGIRPRRNGANYCASKAGLLQLTKCLALELAPPDQGQLPDPGHDRDRGAGDPVPGWTTRPRGRRWSRRSRRGRIGTTEEIADALEFLVGPASGYLTGQKLIVRRWAVHVVTDVDDDPGRRDAGPGRAAPARRRALRPVLRGARRPARRRLGRRPGGERHRRGPGPPRRASAPSWWTAWRSASATSTRWST